MKTYLPLLPRSSAGRQRRPCPKTAEWPITRSIMAQIIGNIAADAPLLFFDSGLGGLTVLAEARTLLPQAPIIYAADYAALPYGTKSEAMLSARVPALLGRLVERFQPRLAVIACNTASTIALAHVRAALDLPIVGTVPAIKPAAAMTRSGVIAVLGTDATVRQPYVDDLSAQFAADKIVLRHGSKELVAAAEAKLHGHPVDPAAIQSAVDGLRRQPHGDNLDTVVLACTHFPLLTQELAAAFGPEVQFIDGSAGIARRIAALTDGQAWPEKPAPATAVFTHDEGTVLPQLHLLQPFGIEKIALL